MPMCTWVAQKVVKGTKAVSAEKAAEAAAEEEGAPAVGFRDKHNVNVRALAAGVCQRRPVS